MHTSAAPPQPETIVKRMMILALVAGLFCSLPALAQLPEKAAPQGMRRVATGGTGVILTSQMGGTRSAHKMLLALKMVSGEYFDKPLTVTRAFADRGDRNLQAAFTAKLKGIPVRGVASVTLRGEGCEGTLLFDRATVFGKSFRTLVAKQSGGGKAAPLKLTRRTAPDGSGAISLPPGFWIAASYQGTFDIDGPNGAYMGLGSHYVCTRPEAAAMFPGIPALDFHDPVRAMLGYLGFMSRKAGVQTEAKVLDARPVQDWPNGRAAFVRYSVQSGGKTTEGFGLFAIMPTDENQALFYQSFINAAPESYRVQFPAMLAAWGTYSINSAVFRQRLMAAAESMRGMSDIMQSANDYRQTTESKVSKAWDDYVRDEGVWRNPDTGTRYRLPTSMTNRGVPEEDGKPLEPVPIADL
jgi:hypothetical protein